jgi:hypothetical protein
MDRIASPTHGSGGRLDAITVVVFHGGAEQVDQSVTVYGFLTVLGHIGRKIILVFIAGSGGVLVTFCFISGEAVRSG